MAETRFILAGIPRSGSEWVRTALDKHPEVICNSEILGGWIPEYMDRTPLNILASHWTWARTTDEARAIGFKLFYLHCQKEREKHVWDYIKQDTDVRIILLLRHNLLKSLASWLLAAKTNVWHVKKAATETRQIEIKNVLGELHDIEDGIAFLKNTFRHHRSIELYYEDVVSGPDALLQILDFLNVTRLDLSGAWAKQEHRPLSAVISNYESVSNTLRGTRYEQFLD